MSTKLLSSLVQTKSIELVLAPIAAQVSQLIILNEAGERDGMPMPDMTPHTKQITEAIQILVLVAQKIVAESTDDDLRAEMPPACDQVIAAGNSMLRTTHNLKQEPMSHKVRFDLVDSARNVLEGTMKVLLVSDEAEVRKVVRAAHWVMDRLGLVQAVTSLKGLVVSFKGFTESLMLLASLCDKRQRELTNPRQRDRLVSATMILKRAIVMLSSTMQTYLKYPGNPQAKASRDYVVGQILLSCTEIIKTVEARGDSESFEEPGYMAATLEKAHKQLSPMSRLMASNELDCYLDAIVRTSMSVANTCEGSRKERIVQACQEVLQTRNELSHLQKGVMSNPSSQRSRREFDSMAEQLSNELKRLDKHVTTAIVDQISDVFADAELPIHNLLSAATASLLDFGVVEQERSFAKLKLKADEFQRHAVTLAQVTRHAAAISADARRVKVVNSSAIEIEKLVQPIIAAAVAVRRSPLDVASVEHLGFLRREWAAKIHLLTSVVDEIMDVREFVGITEANIQEDIAHCREAMFEQDAKKLSESSVRVVGRSRRVCQVARREMENTADPMYKGKLQTAVKQLETAIPSMAQLAEEVMLNVANVHLHQKLSEAARQVAENIKMIKLAVKRVPPGAMDILGSDLAPNADSSNEAERFHGKMRSHGGIAHGRDLDQRLGQIGSGVVPSTLVVGSSSGDLFRNKKPHELSDKPHHGHHHKVKSSHQSLQPVSQAGKVYRRTKSLEELLHLIFGDDGEDDEQLEQVDRRDLLGLAPEVTSGSLWGPVYQYEKPSRAARVPVSRLIKAAKEGDLAAMERQIRDLIARGDRLRAMADKAMENSRNRDSARLVRVTSSEIEKLSPLIVEAARDVTANPRDVVGVERLQMIGREWASKVHVLAGALDNLVMPWSAKASELALAATSGDVEALRRQVDNINDHVTRLRQLAASAKAAADAEDSVDTGAENDAPARDPASLQRVELVQVTSREIEKATPQLISAAEAVARNPTDIVSVDRLGQLRREWASKVHSLVFAVDDVTVGTSAPVEQLASSAMAGDHHALHERSRMLSAYTRSLKEMASAAVSGCSDSKKVARVNSTVAGVERLTTEVHDTARAVTDLAVQRSRTMEQNLMYMSVVERMNLLQREWAAKVHLLTALVDDLTAEVSAPVDRLAGAALSVSRADVSDKFEQQRNFEEQAEELASRVARVRNHASKAVEKSRHSSKVRTVRVTGDFIDRLTPQVIAAARALADNPDQPTVEHFQMLRRQWASKAQLLMATLDELPDATSSAVQAVFQDLFGTAVLDGTQSFESLSEEDAATIAGSSQPLPPSPKPRRLLPSPPQARKRGPRTPSPTRKLPQVPTVRKSVDDIDVGRKSKEPTDRSLTDTEIPDTSRRLRGPWGSQSESDIRKAIVTELHHRFSSSESINKPLSFWRQFERDLSIHRRSVSLSVIGRSPSRSPSTEELRTGRSSKSIVLAARLLKEETDQWEEHNNSIVTVAKKMALQMLQMAEFARGRGALQNKSEMIHTAKAIADNGQVILKFAQVIASQCTDDRSRADLLYYAEFIPTISTQLKIISSVKAATPSDASADIMLTKNAENLMQAVVKTLKAAEAACMKGLRPAAMEASTATAEATELAFQWKRKLKRQRTIEALTAPRDQLGLRKREKSSSGPSLVDIVQV